MHQFQVLRLLILVLLTTTIIEAQYISKPRCSKVCGGVIIPSPFGIGRNCSANEWYTLDCNSSTLYLSALNNVEVLFIDSGIITVNMPVIKADCKNPVKNINLVPSTSHGKNPFLFSRSGNILVVKGCGSAAIMENGTVVSGCSTTCRNHPVSDSNNCFGNGCCQSTILHDLASFTFNLTGLELQDGHGSCGSAFLVAEDEVGSLSSQSSGEVDHAFFSISLSWNDTFDHNSIRCNETCGEVSIPYPFGIERSCSESDWFNVDCNSSTPYLSAFNNVEALGFSYETITVNVPMISDCENPLQNTSLDLISESPFRFSGTDNIFVVEGCGDAVIMENGTVVCGCSTTCRSDTVSDVNNCYGVGCCQTAIPHDLQSFTFNLTGLQRQAENGTCGSAFLVDRKSFVEGRFSQQFVPVTLGWGEISSSLSSECRW